MASAMSKYGQTLREAALRRILPPQSESMCTVARDYGISVQKLANWKKMALSGVLTFDEEEETGACQHNCESPIKFDLSSKRGTVT